MHNSTSLEDARKKGGRQMRALLLFFPLLSGCGTTISVGKIDPQKYNIREVCIEQNPKVIVANFETILAEGFQRNGIGAKVYKTVPPSCEYTLTYTATQKWDFVMVLNDVHLDLYRRDELISVLVRDAPSGIAGGGGLALTKWGSAKSKMDPLMDEWLHDFSTRRPSQESPISTQPQANPVSELSPEFKSEVEQIGKSMSCSHSIHMKEKTQESESWSLDCGDGEHLEIRCFEGDCYITP